MNEVFNKKISSKYQFNCERAEMIWKSYVGEEQEKMLKDAGYCYLYNNVSPEMKYIALKKAKVMRKIKDEEKSIPK